MSERDAIAAMRNAMFHVGNGMTLDAFMQGSIMAQARIATEIAASPDEAAEILTKYFDLAIEAVPLYWKERIGSVTTPDARQALKGGSE